METKNAPEAIPDLMERMKVAGEALLRLAGNIDSLAKSMIVSAEPLRATAKGLLALVEIQKIGAKAAADIRAIGVDLAANVEAPNQPATRQSSVHHHQAPTAAIDAGRVAGAPKRPSKDVQ